MAGPRLFDRVKETTATTGTGTVTLAGAVTGFQSFTSRLADQDTTFYCIEDGTNWEVGIGTFTTSGTTLARTTVLFSSNSDAAVNFGAGSKNVFIANIAEYTSPLIKADKTNSAIHVSNETALSSTLGNARGKGSVDLQTKRSAAAQVASGKYSLIGGGRYNKASGNYCVVAGGETNIASGNYCTVSGGLQNNNGKNNAVIGGGYKNIISTNGAYAVIGGGAYNTITGIYATVPGGRYSKADKYGQLTHASGRFAAQGDAQVSRFVLRAKTTDATSTEMFLDGSSNRMTLAITTTWGFRVNVIARRTDVAGTDSFWIYEGAIRQGANAAATAIIGTTTLLGIAIQDAGAVAWSVTISADTSNGSLKIAVVGAAATTIQWVALVETIETTG